MTSSTPVEIRTFRTASLGLRITILPPRRAIGRPALTRVRTPIEAMKSTPLMSTMTLSRAPAMTLKGRSTFCAPAMSSEPCSVTLRMPPSSSACSIFILPSTALSRVSSKPAASATAVFFMAWAGAGLDAHRTVPPSGFARAARDPSRRAGRGGR